MSLIFTYWTVDLSMNFCEQFRSQHGKFLFCPQILLAQLFTECYERCNTDFVLCIIQHKVSDWLSVLSDMGWTNELETPWLDLDSIYIKFWPQLTALTTLSVSIRTNCFQEIWKDGKALGQHFRLFFIATLGVHRNYENCKHRVLFRSAGMAVRWSILRFRQTKSCQIHLLLILSLK